jgi:hypothetical protein
MWMVGAAFALVMLTTFFLVFSLLTLFLERKFIAIAQKRLGISFLGRNGWAHLPADLLKFWLKHTGHHSSSWISASFGGTGAALGYLTWSLVGCLFFTGDLGTAYGDS